MQASGVMKKEMSQMWVNQSQKMLIISPQNPKQRPTRDKVDKIRKANKKPSLSQLLNQLAYKNLLTTLISQHFQDIRAYLESLVKQCSTIDLLETGEYLIVSDKPNSSTEKYLIISDHLISYFVSKKDQNPRVYHGFRYRIAKSVYFGEFKIVDRNVVEDTESMGVEKEGSLHLVSEEEKKYMKYEGRWRKGTIIEGRRQTYEYKQDGLMLSIKKKIKQSYKGSFENMKYEGKGTLTKYDVPFEPGGIKQIDGIFENGNIKTILPAQQFH